jgi:hypothetical protein
MLSKIDQLVNYKGKPCFSMIISTNKYATMWPFNWGTVKRSLKKSIDLVLHSPLLNPETALEFKKKLENLSRLIDNKKFNRGLGLFVSPTISELVYFPFEVKEWIGIGDSFEIRDLLFYREYAMPYHVLMLSKTKIHLLKVEDNEVKELVDGNFPVQYTDDYEYNKPSRGNSYGSSLKAFEREKSSATKERMIELFKKADSFIDRYKDISLLIICGPQEETTGFVRVTSHQDLMAGTLNLEVDRLTSESTLSKFRDIVFRFKQTKQKEVLEKLGEGYGNQHVAEGIENVWKAAQEGKGLLLAVEKDFKQKAFLKKNGDHRLHTFPPGGEYEIVADAVDDVIETVREKNGKIVFVENEELKKFNHIAMLLRY